ncbi:uncharacterized protein C12orf50 homolog [Columba livia]|uniref:uncharacterized protein C12orf50 homolog n=1 Tax=Columba livia TaxID=8932 RepID=UPI0031BA6FAE
MVPQNLDDNSFLLQQKYSQTSCFWEKQPSGCLRIGCAFQHSKARNINGLFLPPNKNVPLQQGGQERTLHPAHLQEPLRNQENISLPVHAPLIIRLNNAEDEQDDEEDDDKENYVSNWVPKTAAEIEEERTIKEICYKTGEYYRIQHPHKHQSTETVFSPQEKEILLLEAMERDLEKGDGNTTPTTFNNTKRGESWERRIPTERIPRRDYTSFRIILQRKIPLCSLQFMFSCLILGKKWFCGVRNRYVYSIIPLVTRYIDIRGESVIRSLNLLPFMGISAMLFVTLSAMPVQLLKLCVGPCCELYH